MIQLQEADPHRHLHARLIHKLKEKQIEMTKSFSEAFVQIYAGKEGEGEGEKEESEKVVKEKEEEKKEEEEKEE